jgi:SAM-dependent methyltransferase
MKLPPFIRQIGKHVVKATPILRRHILASTDYRVLSGFAKSSGWLSARTVKRQEHAYQGLIAAMNRGDPRVDFRVAAEAIAATNLTKPRVLEVGCGSGYYSEVFSRLLHDSIQYTGIDYSNAMITRARERYPEMAFETADATKLPYVDDAFDIVFNGVSLMHIIDYESAIRSTARVASRFCVLHGVPVFYNHQTVFLRKYAYGAPVVEIIFNKEALLSMCRQYGMHFEREWPCIPYDVYDATGHHSTSETYLFSL